MRQCKLCGAVLDGRRRVFCSEKCADRFFYAQQAGKSPQNVKSPRPRLQNCEICGEHLTGKQGRFCSKFCKNRFHQTYVKQQERGLTRKLELIQRLGGKCSVCGYNKNLAALQFHHLDEDLKEHELDMRSLSNRKLDAVLEEFEKCILLCANCHAELHYPHLELEKIRREVLVKS